MAETKEFPSLAVASLSTRRLLCDFGVMHGCAEWIMGHPIWTHQFPSLADDLRGAVLAQFPDMPTELEGCNKENWRQYADRIEQQFGKMLTVRKGDGLTELSPTDGIPDHLKDRTIVIRT